LAAAAGARLGVGARVFLRDPAARDRAEFLGLVRSSRRFHRPWVSPPATATAFTAFLRRARQPNRVSLLVCRRPDGAIVGVVNVSEIVRGALQGAFLGYYGSAVHGGQGYMTEGLALALRLAFGRLRLHRLEANVQPGNRASLALVQRLGFRLEGFSPRYLKVAGRWRDHQRWAIRREDWDAGRGRETGRRGASP
jgi:ribosomal-protein-alanine N-acetyltransferase